MDEVSHPPPCSSGHERGTEAPRQDEVSKRAVFGPRVSRAVRMPRRDMLVDHTLAVNPEGEMDTRWFRDLLDRTFTPPTPGSRPSVTLIV